MDHKIEKMGISLSFEIIGANMRILGVNELFLIRTNYILFLCQKSGYFFFQCNPRLGQTGFVQPESTFLIFNFSA